MFISCFILAISSSIDSLGIGITYGLKNTIIPFSSKLILFVISLTISFASVLFGDLLSHYFSETFTNIFGSVLLLFIGIFVIFKGIFDNYKVDKKYFDFNNSNLIDPKEAFVLGLALSLDSFGIAFSSSLISANSFLFPLLVSVFQFIFLSLGIWIGKNILKFNNLPDLLYSVISGVLLIVIAFIRFYN